MFLGSSRYFIWLLCKEKKKEKKGSSLIPKTDADLSVEGSSRFSPQ